MAGGREGWSVGRKKRWMDGGGGGRVERRKDGMKEEWEEVSSL